MQTNSETKTVQIVRVALALLVFAAVSLQAQVTFDRLLHTDKEPQNWLTYSGNVSGAALQPAQSDQHRQRQEPGTAVDLAGEVAGEIRNDIARDRRHPLHHSGAQQHDHCGWKHADRRTRRRHRPAILDVLLSHPADRARLLRPRESRTGDTRRHAVHGHAELAPDRRSMPRTAS